MVSVCYTEADVGYVYRLSVAYATQLLDLIIATIAADSLSFNELTLDKVMTSLASDDRPECIQAILKAFSESPNDRSFLSVLA